MENNLAGMFYPLSDKIGKTKADIINDFSQSNQQLVFELLEIIFNGYTLTSEGILSVVGKGDYEYDFQMTGDICTSVNLLIKNEELLNESIEYCTENYPLITDNTWLITSPEAVTVFLFEKDNKKDITESYFQSAPSHQRNLNIPSLKK